MIRTVFFYSAFVFSTLVSTIPLLLWHFWGLTGSEERQRAVAHKTSLLWARFLVWASGTKVEIVGQENVPKEGPVLFVSNHQSNFDIPVLLGCIDKPKGFLAKVELSKIPVINSWMHKMKCVFIDRQDIRQSLKAINECVEVLKSGQSVVIFPEGTRSKGPEMGIFKKGSLRPVEKTDVPVIPITIMGTYKIMEANNSKIRPARVRVLISEALYLDRDCSKKKGDIDHIIRKRIEDNLTLLQ